MANQHVSGAVVTALPDRLEDVRASLAGVRGVDVHESDASTGRLVITIEATSIDEAQTRLRAVQDLDGVAHAQLVIHHTGA